MSIKQKHNTIIFLRILSKNTYKYNRKSFYNSPCSRSYHVSPVREGAYHWAGKQFLSPLSPATQYRARVTALNTKGWSKSAREWNFATLGARPHSDYSTGGAPTSGLSLLLLPLLLLLSRV